LAEGYHQGRGTAHAEAAAVTQAQQRGTDLTGSTAVVTLEPCAHQGYTGPCAPLLAEAGVGRVVVALADPNPVAAGGARYLEQLGIPVELNVATDRGIEVNLAWLHAVTAGRPYVTLKLATSLDGRIAAADGTSQWITGPEARAHAHALRAEVDAIVVGNGTVFADNPALTARLPGGALADYQPLRVSVGHRSTPPGAAIAGPGGPHLHLATHQPDQVLAALAEREVRHVLLEGGATMAGAWLAAGVVDRIMAYMAPIVLGAGQAAVASCGVDSVDHAIRFATQRTTRLGQDVLVEARRTFERKPCSPD